MSCDEDTCLQGEHGVGFFTQKIDEFTREIAESEYVHYHSGVSFEDLALRFEIRTKIPRHSLEHGGAHHGVFQFALQDLVRTGVLLIVVRDGKFVLYRRRTPQ